MYDLVVAVGACLGDSVTPQLYMHAVHHYCWLKLNTGSTVKSHVRVALMQLELLLNSIKQRLQGVPVITVVGLR